MRALLSLPLREICAIHVRSVVAACGGNKKQAAYVLGIGRTTLFRYLKRDTAKANAPSFSTYDALPGLQHVARLTDLKNLVSLLAGLLEEPRPQAAPGLSVKTAELAYPRCNHAPPLSRPAFPQ